MAAKHTMNLSIADAWVKILHVNVYDPTLTQVLGSIRSRGFTSNTTMDRVTEFDLTELSVETRLNLFEFCFGLGNLSVLAGVLLASLHELPVMRFAIHVELGSNLFEAHGRFSEN